METEKLISVRELYFKCDLLEDSIERLKLPYTEILKAIHSDNLDRAVEIIEMFIDKCSSDISMMRMLLDGTQSVRDEETIIPIRKKLIEIIESKIGKIN